MTPCTEPQPNVIRDARFAATVLPFPERPRPLWMTERADGLLTYAFMAGELFWQHGCGSPTVIEPDQALRLRDLYGEEARKCFLARDVGPARIAARFYGELTNALDKLDHHNRCVGKPSPYADRAEELRSRLEASVAAITPEPPSAA